LNGNGGAGGPAGSNALSLLSGLLGSSSGSSGTSAGGGVGGGDPSTGGASDDTVNIFLQSMHIIFFSWILLFMFLNYMF